MRSNFEVFRLIALGALLLVTSAASAIAQSDSTARKDSVYMMPTDTRRLDSAYRARKALLDQWIRRQREAAHPQEDFLSVYAEYGAYLQILPRDLNQLFSERTLRPDPKSDRSNYGTVDRSIVLGGAAQISKSWGIYAEYNYIAKFSNTLVDDTSHSARSLTGIEEELDLSMHSFVVGGMIVLYSTNFYRLRANGGIGGLVAITSETESGSGASRSASAAGFQVNFNLMNDFRVLDNASFTLDFLWRTATTGTLKTSDDKTLDAPFGKRNTPLTVSPNASAVMFGLSVGLVYYF